MTHPTTVPELVNRLIEDADVHGAAEAVLEEAAAAGYSAQDLLVATTSALAASFDASGIDARDVPTFQAALAVHRD